MFSCPKEFAVASSKIVCEQWRTPDCVCYTIRRRGVNQEVGKTEFLLSFCELVKHAVASIDVGSA